MFDEAVSYEPVFTEDEIKILTEEYSRVEDICYLDHTGCPPYSQSVLKESFRDLSGNIYGNPHSGSSSSKFCLDTVDQVRFRILQYFNTSSNEYSVIFTSGATASLKLVAESFVWTTNGNESKKDVEGKSCYAYMEDNHTSVLGMRETLAEKEVEVLCLEEEKTFALFKPALSPSQRECPRNSLFVYSAQSNFSGVKYPLDWVEKVQSGALDSLYPLETSGANWYCLLDAATYVSTNQLDLSSVKPDFVAISFYKMFGFPTGLGALLVRNSSAHLLQKRYYGGGTVFVALSQENTYVPRAVLHERFEDGTINFLSIIALSHGFDTIDKVVGIEKISKHCFGLAQYAYHCLGRLHHGNGKPAAVIYNDTPYDDIKTQGNILNFNLLRPNGEYIGYAEVLNLSNLHGIHLRTGCFCNPGACRKHLKLTTDDVKKHFMSGHVCGDDHDLVDGQPTGSVRISFGPYNSLEDVNKLLNMIVDCFVQKPVLKKFPQDWSVKNIQLCDKFKAEHMTLFPTEAKLKPMNVLYQWLENVGNVEVDNGVIERASVTSITEPVFKENGNSVPHLSHMFLYPVKSCGRFRVNKWELSSKGLKYDREWMITNHAGVALTQKTLPQLCLIRPVIDLERKKLILTFHGYPSLSVGLEEDEGGLGGEAWICSSKVCGDEIRGLDCGDSAALWLSHVLARDGLRLIRHLQRESGSTGSLSLSNQAQYLMINKTSVDWLTDQLNDNADCKEESMLDRFRSNFVIGGLDHPFEEQHWSEVKIGNQDFKVDGPCGRCQMICIDQETGKKTKEPLTTLAASFKGKLKFGIYLSVEGDCQTSLSIGYPIYFRLSKDS